ncbi:O-succinylbenzoic acid--CoA ligase [Chlorogloeopsis fritschii PCC 6912]|uniref:O-succinylbenzoic acid--CoA ligase n=1 Tax=Chlorogloeopsis fritschii PCC 6912 TaxID=211165 RepID=A0A3S0Y623_CHLFR|nr:2-succinylbenzoate--CoA ligase [Chlorogloeopsis fritschii]RUR86163.1 O-succinylbenzoic acid--CoA ligase [Chlorogloeopsis fritschii PCC 6912]
MVRTLKHLVEQAYSLPKDWLIYEHSHQFLQLTEKYYLELTQFSHWQTPPKIILAEREPVQFLAAFLAACATNSSVFLCNPNWVKDEWQQVFELVQPDIIWGMERGQRNSEPPLGIGVKGETRRQGEKETIFEFSDSPKIMIPTGGSSGKIKFAIHTWDTLTASVRGFTEYFQLQQVNSFCVLPLYHVSGLMQFIRSFTTGGKLVILPFKNLESCQLTNINPSDFFISLVPTQLQRLLQNFDFTQWLSQFKTVLLGGAPAWEELLVKARYYQINLSLTYGMTETASGIATLKPDDFRHGKVNCGQILPHAKVTIRNELGEALQTNQIGNIAIQAQSLYLGYYSLNTAFKEANYSSVSIFNTDDLGFLDNEGYLNIIGRSSDKIITGGENVYPLEVESAIRATAMVIDVCVIGIPDRDWGQAVTAIYVPKNVSTSSEEIQNLLKGKLSKFKIPKYWFPVQFLSRNSQGKINRQQLQQEAIEHLNLSNRFS